MSVLVLVEHEAGAVIPVSRVALRLARELADSLAVPLGAVVLGQGAGATAASLREGDRIDALHLVEDPVLEPYLPAAWGRCLAGITKSIDPTAVIAAGTTRGHELLAFAAALHGAPMAAGCLAIRPAPGNSLEVTRARWGGSVLEDARIDAGPAFLGLGELPRAAAEGSAAVGDQTAERGPRRSAGPAVTRGWTVEGLGVTRDDLRTRVVAREAAATGRVALSDARVVVGGGRGVGEAGFAPLEELAALLGGTIGVSRVVTSAGWRPHAEQVGQTGTRISPDLYLACGISGAIQHIVGCRGARAILAINTDPDAPIMSRATHAVIGDLHTVVPAIVDEVRRRRDGGGPG